MHWLLVQLLLLAMDLLHNAASEVLGSALQKANCLPSVNWEFKTFILFFLLMFDFCLFPYTLKILIGGVGKQGVSFFC